MSAKNALIYCGYLDFMALEPVRQRAHFHLFVSVCKYADVEATLCESDQYWLVVKPPEQCTSMLHSL